MLDFIVRKKKKYYSQALLQECKHEIKRTKMENFINEDLESSWSDNESHIEPDNERRKSDNEADNE